MSDPRDEIVESVDLKETQVLSVPGFIFLCGGFTSKEDEDPASVRDHFYRWLQKNDAELTRRIIFAENVNDWSGDGLYKELFTLERHLAALAHVIVLFVESPGSIAELGAFSALSGVREKLLVFIREDHYEGRSFIRLGPIKYLQADEKDPVHIYPWRTDGGGNIDGGSIIPYLPLMYQNVIAVDKERQIRSFDKTQHREQMLMIHALIFSMHGLLISEIDGYLEKMGFEIDRHTLKQFIFVLKKLELISEKHLGKNHYYVATNQTKFLRIRKKDGTVLSTERVQVAASEYYKQEDDFRSRSLAEILAKNTGEGEGTHG